MKKYNLIYDLDKKIIGLYKGINDENKNNKTYLIYIILVIILTLVVIGLIVFIVYYMKMNIKKRAFELNDDNYEYFPTE